MPHEEFRAQALRQDRMGFDPGSATDLDIQSMTRYLTSVKSQLPHLLNGLGKKVPAWGW